LMRCIFDDFFVDILINGVSLSRNIPKVQSENNRSNNKEIFTNLDVTFLFFTLSAVTITSLAITHHQNN